MGFKHPFYSSAIEVKGSTMAKGNLESAHREPLNVAWTVEICVNAIV